MDDPVTRRRFVVSLGMTVAAAAAARTQPKERTSARPC